MDDLLLIMGIVVLPLPVVWLESRPQPNEESVHKSYKFLNRKLSDIWFASSLISCLMLTIRNAYAILIYSAADLSNLYLIFGLSMITISGICVAIIRKRKDKERPLGVIRFFLLWLLLGQVVVSGSGLAAVLH